MAAKDALGDDVKASAWLAKHQPGDRSLTQGLKSDATYLIGKAKILAEIVADTVLPVLRIRLDTLFHGKQQRKR